MMRDLVRGLCWVVMFVALFGGSFVVAVASVLMIAGIDRVERRELELWPSRLVFEDVERRRSGA